MKYAWYTSHIYIKVNWSSQVRKISTIQGKYKCIIVDQFYSTFFSIRPFNGYGICFSDLLIVTIDFKL